MVRFSNNVFSSVMLALVDTVHGASGPFVHRHAQEGRKRVYKSIHAGMMIMSKLDIVVLTQGLVRGSNGRPVQRRAEEVSL